MDRFFSAGHKKSYGFLMLLAISFFLLSTSGLADDKAAAGRKIIAEKHDSVITLQMVIRTRMGMGGREMHMSEERYEITATLIDPSGLAVFSLSASNPGEFLSKFLGSGSPDEPQMESEITEIKMRLVDGTEMPASIVMRDKDLDLAFVRPAEQPSEPLPALDLSENAEARILDPVIFLGRMGREGGWVPSAVLARIRSIIERPRTFYLPEDEDMSAYGSPVLNLEGKVIGILLLRTSPTFTGFDEIGFGAMFGGPSSLGIFPVILPAADILEVAGQIPVDDD